MDSAGRNKFVMQAVEHAVVREVNDFEWLFREGVLTVGPPYTCRLQAPNCIVLLLAQDKEVDAFQALLTDLRQRVRSVRTITTKELQEQLLLALARVAAGAAKPVTVEQLAPLVGTGEPVVSMCELDGLEWLGEPVTLAPGVVLGRVSDALEYSLADQVGDPRFTLVADFFHPITEDFQGDRVDPPEAGDNYQGHYPVVLCLATSDRSVANNLIVLRRLAAALGAALWLFEADRRYDFTRPRIRDHTLALNREFDTQLHALVWSGDVWQRMPEDRFWHAVAAESVLAGVAGKVFGLAARAVSEPHNAMAKRTLACLRTAASACDQSDPYDRLLLLVGALEALVVSKRGDPVQATFAAQLGRLTDGLYDPSALRHLYDVRSSLAHDGLLDDKQEARLLWLTHTVAVPCLRAGLTKLVQLHETGATTAADLLAWHSEGSA